MKINLVEQPRKIANIGSWEYDIIRDKIKWHSESIFKLFGVTTQKIITKEDFFNSVHEDDRAMQKKLLEESLQHNKLYKSEYRIVRSDGSIRYVQGQLEFIVNNQGASIRAVGTIQDVTEIREIQIQTEKYRSLFHYNPDLVYSFDLSGNFTNINPTAEHAIGFSYDEVIGQSYLSIVAPDYQKRSCYHFEEAKKGTPQKYDLDIITKKGEMLNLLATKFPIIINNKVIGVYGVAKDVTAERDALAKLASTEKRFRSLVEYSLAGVYIIQEEKVVYANPRAKEILGADIVGTHFSDYIYKEDLELVRKNLEKRISNEQPSHRYEARFVHKDGRTIYAEIYGSRTILDGKVALLGTFLDITEQKELAKQHEYLAYHDHLTSLNNRRKFENDLDELLQQEGDHRLKIAAIYIDFDRFKHVNDSLGHMMGDLLLIEIAKRLNSIVSSKGSIYRIGGDEFAIVLSGILQSEEINALIQTVVKEFEKTFIINHFELYITPSIGISLFPDYAKNKVELMQQADTAMYYAKEKKDTSFEWYTPSLKNNCYQYITLERDIRKALSENEFSLHYQPKVNGSGEIVGAEALIRWDHPQRGIIFPDVFIPFSEETGLITQIDQWVQRKACEQLALWREEGHSLVPISLNLSAKSIENTKIISNLEKLMSIHDINPCLLEVEITETALIKNAEVSVYTLSKIRNLGITISLDDFGKGYSSLSYLNGFKKLINVLKIDRSFISELPEEEFLTNTIIFLGKQMGMKVISEGVETKEQYLQLKKQGCNEMQGYYFSKPLPASEFEKLIRSRTVGILLGKK
jgi:diguanylate cyclase (GGDEF)-like protein/PAS domain S-box-containing protein